ncbi:hypothetical protein K9B35_00135 [Sphingomonas sp. R647]|uniref:hypothetical protein n=1 Tax=Sphingomonas sp. R647 TaxID=2875233 RepID=UPI001CD2E603|nr:hypothetical protein [Sphingomonas sp. R647]MCA1196362.1 hypothetical protein [Sphingomonas sp. R647]
MDEPAPSLRARPGWVAKLARAVDLLCFVMLIATMATVIYGFSIRALWADGYYVAVALALLGSFVMLIGIAQQAIAARDAATWRDMAEWQIRAAEARLAATPVAPGEEQLDRDSPVYYEMLIGTLVDHASRESTTLAQGRPHGH